MNLFHMSKRALFVECIIIFLAVIYGALQVIYGIRYHIPMAHYLLNILAVAVVYLLQTYLYFNPWKINRLPREACVGKVEKYSMHLAQIEKLIFIGGLLVPCIFDLAGIELKEGFSVILICLLVGVAIFYEWRIYQELQGR